jgi:single-strand DNA-binding protein
MSVTFDYDDSAAGGADREPMTTGAYIGKFTRAAYIETDGGAKGIEFEFEAPGQGTAQFTVYMVSKEGKQTFGYNQVQALQFLMGVKGLKSQTGKVRKYVDGKWEEVDGERFVDLEGKPIGVVLQKELTTKNGGGDSFRWNLAGQFQPETKLTASELKERVSKPEKLGKLLKNLKDKDSRKHRVDAEPSQPALGADVTGF